MADFQETCINAMPLEDTLIININMVHILTCEFEFHFCRRWNNKILTNKFCCCFQIDESNHYNIGVRQVKVVSIMHKILLVKSSVTNTVTMQNFEIMSDKSNMYTVCT